ncbi:hypothetical protein DLAC_08806 [Tieghemostelium lacteum]|uniref:Uncharacterized protein n=1 Tax=Tieghemostelium lacteum TaxID=361077 RepID=A0A151Z8A9_TIELA|nr:hypothetical protein DLAC_08806 [Tieghemostelium lacteum]|eukprot:KYQ90206.1 hypothetical protein DLAC_08806 [Tieghemostelium lacteum]
MNIDNNNTQPTSFNEIDLPKEHWDNDSIKRWCKVIGVKENDIKIIEKMELDGYWFNYKQSNLEALLGGYGVSIPSSVRIHSKFNPKSTTTTTTTNTVQEFDWGNNTEPSMMEKSVKHLSDNFKLPGFIYYNVSDKKEFLYTNHSSLPNIIKGGVDVVIVPDFIAIEDLDTSFHFAIELKTNEKLVESGRFQAYIQLLASNLRSTSPVVHIITDLRNSWRFRWFEDNSIISYILPPHHKLMN